MKERLRCFHITRYFVLPMVLYTFLPNVSYANNEPHVTGTYSNIHHTTEGGDLEGFELWVVPTVKGIMVVYQLTTEWPSSPIVILAKVKGNFLSFTVPDTEDQSGIYSGIISEAGFSGTWKHLDSQHGLIETPFSLKRQESYWNKHP